MRKRTRFFFIQNKVLCLLRTIQGWSQGLCCWHHIWGEDWERAWKEKRRSSSLPLKPGVPEVMVGFTGIYTDLKFFIEVRNRKSNLRVIHIEKITEGFEWGCRERDNAQEMILGGDTHGGGGQRDGGRRGGEMRRWYWKRKEQNMEEPWKKWTSGWMLLRGWTLGRGQLDNYLIPKTWQKQPDV